MKRFADWNVLATAWELAALSFRYPGNTLAQAVCSGEWADAACEVAVAIFKEASQTFSERLLVATEPLGEMRDKSCDVLLHELRVEATRLFVGTPEAVCSPYEGVWRARADGVQPLLYVNPHSMDVERFCHACGFGRPEGTNEPLDHAATECELLEVLSFRASDVSPVDTYPVADADLPGGSSEAAYEQFIREHVAKWMPMFAQELRAQAQHPFFRAAAEYLATVLEAGHIS